LTHTENLFILFSQLNSSNQAQIELVEAREDGDALHAQDVVEQGLHQSRHDGMHEYCQESKSLPEDHVFPFPFRERQKVKPYFLPVQSAKKSRQSQPFFGEKATQHQGRANFSLFFHGLKARLPAFKPKLICQKVVVVF
jgi:hypothetical protein